MQLDKLQITAKLQLPCASNTKNYMPKTSLSTCQQPVQPLAIVLFFEYQKPNRHLAIFEDNSIQIYKPNSANSK